MKMTIKLIAAVAVLSVLAGCGVNTSGNINFNANSLQYAQDDRTGLCFAIVASRKTGNIETTGLGMSEVPCTNEVISLIE